MDSLSAENFRCEEILLPNQPLPENQQSPSWLLKRVASGDELAATTVFQRYAARLTALARSRLSKKLSARVDADDIVMSAYRSFFVRARQGAFSLETGGDLWRLLVEITLHKLYRQNTFHNAQRRSVRKESEESGGAILDVATPRPSPDVAVAAAEEIEMIMAELSPECRAVLELRLQGHELREIAAALNRSDRTIRRWLDQCREVMRRRFPSVSTPSAARSATIERKRGARRTSKLRRSTAVDAVLAFDDFTLIRQIGAGATGKVYLAVDKRSDTTVAVKFLKKRFLNQPEVVSRFAHEAHLLQQLEHPGIVRILGLGRTPNGGLFIAMSFLPGGDLGTRLMAGLVQEDDAIRWVSQAAVALEYAHQQSIIHCDLKPSNVLLDINDRIVVTDFGLARSLKTGPFADDYVAGTPAFMAPEQVEPSWGPLTARTDVYGLGAVLYSLLAGRPPHDGVALEVLAAIASGRMPTIPVDVRPALAQICRRCLAPNPDERFPTAISLFNALSELKC